MNATPEQKTPPRVLVIAGSDSSGLAGIQRDNQTVLALGAHPLNVISANTAQTGEGVHSCNWVSSEVFDHQLQAATAQPVMAIKLGLLHCPEHIVQLANLLQSNKNLADIPLIIDPVLRASSGEAFGDERVIADMRAYLLPLCDLITPNLHEASRFTGIEITTREQMQQAAQAFLIMGAKGVLIKGGHLQDYPAASSQVESYCYDYFCCAEQSFWLRSPLISTPNTRGTGCALASAIASAQALGFNLADAVVIGKMAINQGLRQAYALHNQKGPVNICRFPDAAQDLPELLLSLYSDDGAFPAADLPSGESRPLGLYPIVDSSLWLERLLPSGITTVQLRIKNTSADQAEKEIAHAVYLSEKYNCRLFINDHWQLAIRYNAYGVHLGQEDLATADITRIRAAGLRLGISTHCHRELARAVAVRPSYIACGPIYHTDSKKMPWIPHGVSGLAYWRKLITFPLVAIGGINADRLADVLAIRPDGIAMISAITQAENPEQQTRYFINKITASAVSKS